MTLFVKMESLLALFRIKVPPLLKNLLFLFFPPSPVGCKIIVGEAYEMNRILPAVGLGSGPRTGPAIQDLLSCGSRTPV